jgi:hypothetical protein
MKTVLSDRSAWNDRNGRHGVGTHLGRLRTGSERVCVPELRFDRGAPDGRRRRKLRTQLVPLLRAVPTSMDFRGVQTSAHDDAPSKRYADRGRQVWSSNSAIRVAHRPGAGALMKNDA